MAAPPASVVAPPDPALVLGRYRPLRPLGSGGSGSVWLARDEASGEEIALKIVRREGKAASRVEREVEAAARLRHPRCLRSLALDRDDEHMYVAYEYVRGRTLRETMRAGDLDDRSAVEATAQVLEGLAHAHARGIVHRDVKPANVMVSDEEELSIRLLDFGLAQIHEADTLTAVGDVPGTLAYVSPERLDGEPASGAADVWSAGVLLWEALAGWHPFAAASPVETARRIREGAKPLASLRPDLPRELCTAVDRMLAVDPARRPAAKRLPPLLHSAFELRARRPRPAASLSGLRERALHAAAAAVFTTGTTLLLPFFPRGWPFLLGLLAAGVALRAPRAGLALALSAPILPLGNEALGLALLYAAVAFAWLVLFARDPRSGLLFVAGPALAPLALGLLPIVALRARGTVRRGALAGTGVLAAGAVTALAGAPLPLEGIGEARLALGGTEPTGAVAHTLLATVWTHSALLVEAGVFALAAATAALARNHGLWGIAGWASLFLAAAVLAPPASGALPLVLGVWAAAAWLAAGELRSSTRNSL
ncbi:MAG: serine/threonine protein kinase [Actinobacteria bacterium]|nr:serine/threonine protein kinase [Actinomycetota bacterium]